MFNPGIYSLRSDVGCCDKGTLVGAKQLSRGKEIIEKEITNKMAVGQS